MTTGVSLAAGATAWGIISDINQKKNITPLNHRDIMERVSKLGVYSYSMKGNPDEQICYGTVSQEWHSIFETRMMKVKILDDLGQPQIDEKGEILYREEPAKDLLRIDQGDMIGVLMSCVKDLHSRVKELEKERRFQ
jgi:hypothetical protein